MDLTESEKNKLEKGLCPKCGDGLTEFTETKTENGRERERRFVVCNNYYCRWETAVPDKAGETQEI